MMAKRESQTMQPAKHRRKNMTTKEMKTAIPVAIIKYYQLFLISLMKFPNLPDCKAEVKLAEVVLKAVENMVGLGTHTLLST